MAILQDSLLRAIDQTADWAGVGRSPLDAESLMRTALRRTGRTEFSDTSFVEPLRSLLAAYESEADLSLFGRYAARFDVLRSLTNLLHFDAAEEADPAIARRPISPPIFIAGLPRSGTTFLHTLLAQDPAHAVPRIWQLIYPFPERRRPGQADRRRERVERQLRLFRHLSPGLDGMHPLTAEAPQECTEITAQVFQSLRFDTTHHIPSYLRWIDAYGHQAAYGFHRRFLRHLDAQAPGRRWVLKCPDHVFALDALLSTYPDAQIVLLHRDPLSVLASVAKLMELLRRPFSRHIDRAQIGRQVSERWADGAARMVAERSRKRSRPVLHLRYRDLVTAPMETVSNLYRHCEMPLTEETQRRMQAYLACAPRGGYGSHRYNLTEFGLDPVRLRVRFEGYMDVFRVGSVPEHTAAA